jgi:hypothetical protein
MIRTLDLDVDVKIIGKQFSKLNDSKYLTKELSKIEKVKKDCFLSLTYNQKVNMNILKKIKPIVKNIGINPTIIHNFKSIKDDYYDDIIRKEILEFNDKIPVPYKWTDQSIDTYFEKLQFYEIEQSWDEVKCLEFCRANDYKIEYGDMDLEKYSYDKYSYIPKKFKEYKDSIKIDTNKIPPKTLKYLDNIDKMRLKFYRKFHAI